MSAPRVTGGTGQRVLNRPPGYKILPARNLAPPGQTAGRPAAPPPPRQPIAGTSETPSVTDVGPQTGTGTIVGVIGGYQEGGSTAAISYSPYLGEQVEQLYHQAAGDEAAPAG